MIQEYIFSTLLMISMYLIFLCIFFFTFGAYIEKLSVANQSKNIVHSLTIDFKRIMDVANVAYPNSITWKPIKVDENSNKDLDKKVSEQNSKVVKMAIKYCSITVAILLSIAAIIFIIFKFDLSHALDVVKKNIIMIFFVCLTQVAFFSGISANYLTLDPKDVKLSIINTLTNIKTSCGDACNMSG